MELNHVSFIPANSFYWMYDKMYYFHEGVLYIIPIDLYNQVKHYLKKQHLNNC